MADQQRRHDAPRAESSSAPLWPSDADADRQQMTSAARDISQLHTQRLSWPPALPDLTTPPQHVLLTHPPLPEPALPASVSVSPPARNSASDPRTEAIAAHLKDAIRLRREAAGLLASLQVMSAASADASERWLNLLHLIGRTPEQNQTYQQLEKQILDYSRRLANVRQQWSVRMAHAREHEEIARVMQDASMR